MHLLDLMRRSAITIRMTHRERLRQALRHQPTDRPPIDLGSLPVTGIAASTLGRLRAALGLGGVVKVHEPMQLLGWVDDDVRERLGIDTVGLWSPVTKFGYRNDAWQPWKLQDGTDVLISGHFRWTIDENGDVLTYPKGDTSIAPSARLPKGGYYFDAIVRQGPIDEDHLDPSDFAEQFSLIGDEDLATIARQAEHYYRNTDYGLVGAFGGAGFGDISYVPGVGLANPRGVRDPERWYECILTHADYIRGIFEVQADYCLKNLERYRQAVGERIEVIHMSGTDFGTQRGLFISPAVFRDLWKPFYRRVNDWVHANTGWKTFYHTCGGVEPLIEDFIEMGVDILNPVQCSAAGMEPLELKARYGDRLVFWGGGVDTQQVLPFGTAEDVRRQVRERVEILGKNGGYVFNPIHNVQHGTPVENLLAMFEAIGRG